VLLEPNVVPGRVTRWLARSAASVCVGFKETAAYFPSAVPATVTGNPARPSFERLYNQARESPLASQKRLIVIGGSGRNTSLNEHMPRALARLREQLAGWQIVHQTGDGYLKETERRYHEYCLNALVFAFIDEMAPLMFGSDLVVCRAGATTLAELSLAGVPAILVPSPSAIDDQWPNAEVYASAGAATVIDESDLPGSLEAELVQHLKPLLCDESRRLKMAAQIGRLARPDAGANICNVICESLSDMSVRLAA
jgi:UDP-N-acetylglucosamine--N-acetylmuramyl-(pentapeptide) pyrophosphoryl-undecaprenol N-acetylglucosamine transferase